MEATHLDLKLHCLLGEKQMDPPEVAEIESVAAGCCSDVCSKGQLLFVCYTLVPCSLRQGHCRAEGNGK